MSGTLLAFVALALCFWLLRNRVAYQRHVRKVAEIERRLSLSAWRVPIKMDHR